MCRFAKKQLEPCRYSSVFSFIRNNITLQLFPIRPLVLTFSYEQLLDNVVMILKYNMQKGCRYIPTPTWVVLANKYTYFGRVFSFNIMWYNQTAIGLNVSYVHWTQWIIIAGRIWNRCDYLATKLRGHDRRPDRPTCFNKEGTGRHQALNSIHPKWYHDWVEH